jgi:hypothetical protein
MGLVQRPIESPTCGLRQIFGPARKARAPCLLSLRVSPKIELNPPITRISFSKSVRDLSRYRPMGAKRSPSFGR